MDMAVALGGRPYSNEAILIVAGGVHRVSLLLPVSDPPSVSRAKCSHSKVMRRKKHVRHAGADPLPQRLSQLTSIPEKGAMGKEIGTETTRIQGLVSPD
jgi:hypothetical protein